jgi:hypothetical protein
MSGRARDSASIEIELVQSERPFEQPPNIGIDLGARARRIEPRARQRRNDANVRRVIALVRASDELVARTQGADDLRAGRDE